MSNPLTRAIDLLDSTALFLESYAWAASENNLPNLQRHLSKKADELRREIARLNEVEELV